MKRGWIFFKVAVTALLVMFLIRHVDWTHVALILKKANWILLVLYCGFQLLGTFLSSFKWSFLASVQGFQLTPKKAFFQYLLGSFLNNFFPSTLGGDTYRTFVMSKQGERYRAFTVVLFDRLSGLMGLLFLAGIGMCWMSWDHIHQTPWLFWLLVGIAGMAVLVAGTFVGSEWMYAQGKQLLGRYLGQQKMQWLEPFEPFFQKKVYRKNFGISVLFAFVGVAITNFFLFWGIGVPLSFQAYVGSIFIATAIANIPVTINNLGIKEWSYVFFFGMMGVSAEVAVTVVLLSRVLQFLLSLGALPIYWNEKKKLSLDL